MFRSRMYSPKRMNWVGKKHAGGCVFCRIAKGDKKIPTRVVHKDDRFMVVLNMFPYNTGHIQVVPVRHAATIEELEDKDVAEMFVLVKSCLLMLKKAIKPLGFNVGINQGGDVAGASIEHLHVHIVPRFKRDFGFMEIIGSTKVFPEDIDTTYRKLKKHAGMLER